jgi:hypothetical protein
MSNSPTPLPLSNEAWRRKIYAYMAHRTESGADPSSVYRLSHTGTKYKRAGYSVGRIQVDLAGMAPQRQKLLEAVYAWLKAQGKQIDQKSWMENATAQLSKRGDPTALSTENTKAINDYLATPAGHDFADQLSEDAFETIMKDRGSEILKTPALLSVVKDPQSLSMLYKRLNLGNPKELSKYLEGSYKFSPTPKSQPLPTVSGSEVFEAQSLQGDVQAALTTPGQVTFKASGGKDSIQRDLPKNTGIILKSAGFFVKSSAGAFDTLGMLTLKLVGSKAITFNSPTRDDVVKPEGEFFIQDRRIIFKKLTYVTHTAKITPEQKSGEAPLTPTEFYENYARFMTWDNVYRGSVKKIYSDDASFFSDVDAMPDMGQRVDWSVWYPLDPDNFLPFNVKPAILDEWAKDPRNKDKRPLDRSIIEEYLKTNRRIQGEMLRAVAPNEHANQGRTITHPGETLTPPMPYRAPDGSTRTISYRVKNDVVANGKRVLAEAARTPEGLAGLDIAVGYGRYPSENSGPRLTVTSPPVFTPQKPDSKPTGTRRAIAKPSAVKPKKSFFDRLHSQATVQPIVFGGPEPLKRPPPPAPEDAPVTLKQLHDAQDALLLDLRVEIMNRPAPEIDVYALHKKLARVDYLDALQGRTIHSRA